MLTGQHPFGAELQGLYKLMTGKSDPIPEELLLRHRPLCQRILTLLRVDVGAIVCDKKPGAESLDLLS